MDSARWEQLKVVFAKASGLAGAERSAYLAQACGGDDALRREVEQLLAVGGAGGAGGAGATGGDAGALVTGGASRLMREMPTTLHGPGPSVGGALTEEVGMVIGPYTLSKRVETGGQGSVWLAEEAPPRQRTVAMKFLSRYQDEWHRSQFDAEQRSLARMTHPNIAQVFDGDIAPWGKPYLVLEHVNGDSITRFADAHRLTLRERLELLTQVCLAVQHAHQKGIIHRDITPNNVLVSMVDGRPQSKLIDFGLAMATGAFEPGLTDQDTNRSAGAVGTPGYMSPEQAAGASDIDTQTDVYALGGLLYELVSGSTPIESERLKQATRYEILRMIREDEPPTPSMRLSHSPDTLARTAAARKTDPARLISMVRGELDWIAMKALEKDRNRRYETASALADDVRRYLRCEPVKAAPQSRAYSTRKFVQRNKGAVLAIGSIAAVVMAAGVTVIVLAQETLRQATIATAKAEEAKRQAMLAESNAEEAERQAELVLDAAAFAECTTYDAYQGTLEFRKPPTTRAIRHFQRGGWLDQRWMSAGLGYLKLRGYCTVEVLEALTATDSGLRDLTALDLSESRVRDNGLKALAVPGSGLQGLVWLNLSYSDVTADGLKALAAADTGLKNLSTLSIENTPITPDGFKALSSPDTGLKNLRSLSLASTSFLDEQMRIERAIHAGAWRTTRYRTDLIRHRVYGMEVLARADSGLMKLSTLDLSGSAITDDGLRALAAADTGLKNLKEIDLSHTSVTEEGLAAIRARFPGIMIKRD